MDFYYASSFPWELQTDIIGTGGSSGSPIIHVERGQVTGIAQNVLTGAIEASIVTLK